MQQANIINIITNKYEPQQKHRLGTVSKNQMKANPDKFQALAVGEKTHAERPTFKIGERTSSVWVLKLNTV